MNPALFANSTRLAKRAAILLGLFAFAAALQAQSDNFDDGNDAGWSRCTSYPGTYTFPTDLFGGRAYRLQGTPKTGDPDPNSRALSLLTNRIYTNFYASVDVVAWNTNQDCDEVVGIISRADDVTAGTPNAVIFNVRLHMKRAYSGPGNTGPLGARDQMSIYSILNAGGFLALNSPLGFTFTTSITGFRWVPGHAYRLVLSCTNNPTSGLDTFTGSVYDLNDLTRPVLSMTGDTAYGGGNSSVPPYGYLGVFAYKYQNSDFDPTVDATFDNFYAAETPPTSVVAPAIPHGVAGAPQVANRSPASFKNFHPAASGISFNATTLTTTNAINTNAIKLVLNGVDVSSGLSISGPTTNAAVSYARLASNTVYDASTLLQDTLGRRTTNVFTFDTFTDGYLASTAVKNIECEDYDFNGDFIDNPPPSGFATNDTSRSTPINSGVGYVDLAGVAGLDFRDYDNAPKNAVENQFRYNDPVGTMQGDLGDIVVSMDGASFLGNPNFAGVQTYDTQRSKYSSVDPALHEYLVRRVEGGEWLNYTRVFYGSNYYNAYLRVAGGLAQPVRLDQIDAGPGTNFLGVFNVPSTFFLNNYRYVPLVETNGRPAVISLSGTNTIRLTMDSPQTEGGTKQGLAMNYFVLVPAAPQLLSAAQVNGTYTPELNVLLDTGAKRITVPQSGGTRFYRIVWTQQVRITNISLAGGNVVLTYQ